MLAWFAVLSTAACSKNPTAGTDGNGDDGPLPGFDAPPPQGLFPLHVSADHGSLVTDDGKPFLLHGEAAWSLIVQLSVTDAMRYLADRHDRNVNMVLVNLIEHKYADKAPRNLAGDAPFTIAGDFSKPNEAYFAHADRVIDLAASQGIAVLLVPAYLGYGGGDEGWYQEMTALAAMGTKCRGYGDFVGQRYAGKRNIIWVWGGDYTPPSGSPGETCLAAIRDGIRAAAPSALATGHWAPESTSRDEAAFLTSIELVGVYTYRDVLPRCRSARGAGTRMPTYLFETCYEHETIQSCVATSSEVRRRQWWGFLGCGAGEIVGNNPIWKFGSGWQQQLGSPVSLHEQRLFGVVQQLSWQTLELDDTLVTPRGTGYAEIAATRTADHKQALIYVPPDGAASFSVDLGHLSGAVTAKWLDPTVDKAVDDGSNLTGVKAFTTPGNNMGGDRDWLLMLTVP